MHYLWNCFWFIVPVLLVNVSLARRLPAPYQPAVFSRNIPLWLAAGENMSRIAVLLLPLFMPLRIETPRQWAGLAVYLAGLLIYLLAWVMQIWYAQTRWSSSRLGFMAPAYTPALWLVGIAMVSEGFYFRSFGQPWLFLALSLIFLVFHNTHAWKVYSRIRTN